MREALSARPLEIIFWSILIFLAFMRGRLLGLGLLAVLPVLGAALSLAPGPAWLWWLASSLNAACLIGGLILKPRQAKVAPAALKGSAP